MAKTGPTPRPDAPAATLARRVPTPELLEVAVPMAPPNDQWLGSTQAAYTRYCESTAARVLREEDVAEVELLFTLIDRRWRYIPALTSDPADDLKTLQAIKIIDGMIDRKCANLGIGPLARTRLGIARIEQSGKLAAAVAAHPNADF